MNCRRNIQFISQCFFIYVFVIVIYVFKNFKGCFSDCLYYMNSIKLQFVTVTSFYLLFKQV